jgi:hypothetical protein
MVAQRWWVRGSSVDQRSRVADPPREGILERLGSPYSLYALDRFTEERMDMPFPTSDEMAAVGAQIYYRSLEKLLRQRAPEYAERVERPDAPPFYLKVRLDDRTSVMLTLLSRSGVWVIADPQSAQSQPRVWSADTPREVLIEALKVRVAAQLEGTPEPSPWRWDEAVTSAPTELADLLAAEGFTISSVIAGNRVVATGAELSSGQIILDALHRDGAYVRAGFEQLHVHVALKPTLGWVADVRIPDERQWRRLDLGRLITGHPSAVPGISAESLTVPRLAGTLAANASGLLGASGGEPVPSPLLGDRLVRSVPSEQSGRELASYVATQLHAMTFGDIEVRDDSVAPLRSQSFHVVWRGNPEGSLGLPELQRLNGVAAAAGKPLMVISAGHVTRRALDFADDAKAFVFRLDTRLGVLFNGNDRCAEAYLTEWTEWTEWIAPSDRATRS